MWQLQLQMRYMLSQPILRLKLERVFAPVWLSLNRADGLLAASASKPR
jgi:hypothetical protein